MELPLWWQENKGVNEIASGGDEIKGWSPSSNSCKNLLQRKDIKYFGHIEAEKEKKIK